MIACDGITSDCMAIHGVADVVMVSDGVAGDAVACAGVAGDVLVGDGVACDGAATDDVAQNTSKKLLLQICLFILLVLGHSKKYIYRLIISFR